MNNTEEPMLLREGDEARHWDTEKWKETGATLLSPLEKGQLLLKCDDGCFEDVKLKDIKGCNFPEAVGREPVTTLWSAWLAASIFMRTDLDLEEMTKFHREEAVCFDSEALRAVLKMAYNKCVD
ncbi:hypothetical protein OESDEN_09173 [Oesophagostomum dentatum]|uniref:Uncharacterized protein n=1 Tax=Oesophagostomum dentatum TaxID=61180 RepID=A0A0B1T145_OESDE|nr:hypothetical protein OESDEN_09173 [Oesophagostomum dentatum]